MSIDRALVWLLLFIDQVLNESNAICITQVCEYDSLKR